jgi:uncharacterized Fe-S cluster-containing radical SAM superfamily protein
VLIDTDSISDRYRAQLVDHDNRRLLITNFRNTKQEVDLTEPANCNGFGRIRHFKRVASKGWPPNPLPIDPACNALSLPFTDMLRAQAFQNAACNWRCWYCFVPFDLLSANRNYSDWLSPAVLVDLYLDQPDPPPVIDLTGGQPDLVPEWVPWMMTELRTRGLERSVYLWSDDNLSNDYFWRFLSECERELVSTYVNYGKVCCFKGFNAESFSFNTLAEPSLFDRQFDLMERLLATGIDIYAYATITTPSSQGISDDIRRFVDRLQMLDENLPLRTVPLEIEMFTPVAGRLDEVKRRALNNQWIAVEAWQREIEGRFSSEKRARSIVEVSLHGRSQTSRT